MKESFVYCPKTGDLEIVCLEPESLEEGAQNRVVSCTGQGKRGTCDLSCTRFWINRYLSRELNASGGERLLYGSK